MKNARMDIFHFRFGEIFAPFFYYCYYYWYYHCYYYYYYWINSGAKITTITYVLQIALNLFFAPFLVRLIGPKKAIILGDCLYIVYVLVNAFSSRYLTLYISSLKSFYFVFAYFSSKLSETINRIEHTVSVLFVSFTSNRATTISGLLCPNRK